MSSVPFRFANDAKNTGAIREFLVSEEDYLAYRAGKFLSQLTKFESSALTDGQTGTTEDVGTFVDTVYNSQLPSDPAVTKTREYTASISGTSTSHTHTIAGPPLPPLVYQDDTVVITVTLEAAHSQAGFEELQSALTFTQGSNYTVDSVVANPTATSITGTTVSWEGFGVPRQGTFTATYTLSFTGEGYLGVSIDTSSFDEFNPNETRQASFESFIRVEDPDAFGCETAIETRLFQENTAIQEAGPDKRNPVYFDRIRNGLKEMNEAELDILTERLVQNLVENERPGTFRLSADTPGDDWVVWLQNIFIDTRSDGSSVAYSIWLRQDDTQPVMFKPITIRRENNNFAGLQEMNDK